MNDAEFHEQIDELAAKVEKQIEEHQAYIEGLPDFQPRSRRARKLRKQVEKYK